MKGVRSLYRGILSLSLFAAAVAAAGCAFDPSGELASASPGEPDAGSGGPDGAATGADAQPAPDATPTSTLGLLVSSHTDTQPVLDGQLDPIWLAQEWMTFDIADAEMKSAVAGYVNSAKVDFAAMHDSDYLYFFFAVTDDILAKPSEVHRENDGVSLFLDGLGDRSGPYDLDDHHIFIDLDGSFFDYGPGTVTLDGVRRLEPTGYNLEIRIAKDSIGMNADFGAIGFNLGLTDNDNIGHPSADARGVWYKAPPPHCPSCCQGAVLPDCDTSVFGELLLLSP